MQEPKRSSFPLSFIFIHPKLLDLAIYFIYQNYIFIFIFILYELIHHIVIVVFLICYCKVYSKLAGSCWKFHFDQNRKVNMRMHEGWFMLIFMSCGFSGANAVLCFMGSTSA
ncbi:hypothetical protein I3842_14G097300 [Carya illinoinensis]|uniref:Transmembrane protein n=1 Tax=Carya illinoinensis TaxID=32201 RepID=A0A922DD22_CARIL|nr:hypothetical protein I3842_14G097300 [Carya illinoinensis]